jgi:hypothetical protein
MLGMRLPNPEAACHTGRSVRSPIPYFQDNKFGGMRGRSRKLKVES